MRDSHFAIRRILARNKPMSRIRASDILSLIAHIQSLGYTVLKVTYYMSNLLTNLLYVLNCRLRAQEVRINYYSVDDEVKQTFLDMKCREGVPTAGLFKVPLTNVGTKSNRTCFKNVRCTSVRRTWEWRSDWLKWFNRHCQDQTVWSDWMANTSVSSLLLSTGDNPDIVKG